MVATGGDAEAIFKDDELINRMVADLELRTRGGPTRPDRERRRRRMSSSPLLKAWWATSPLSGAIGILHLHGDLDPCLRRLTGTTVPMGGCRLADLAGADRGLVIRPSVTGAMLMPHGGPHIRRLLSRAVVERGDPPIVDVSMEARWAEATDLVEAASDALSPGSPRAIERSCSSRSCIDSRGRRLDA